MITAYETSKLKEEMSRELNANPSVVLACAAGCFLGFVLIVVGASWHRYQEVLKPFVQEQIQHHVPVRMDGADEADLALGETIPVLNAGKNPTPLAIAGVQDSL